MYVCMCACMHIYVWVPVGSKEGGGSPRVGVIGSCKSPNSQTLLLCKNSKCFLTEVCSDPNGDTPEGGSLKGTHKAALFTWSPRLLGQTREQRTRQARVPLPTHYWAFFFGWFFFGFANIFNIGL